MVKSFRYVFKRILIGVGIALVLSYIRGNLLLGVSARELSSVWQPLNEHEKLVNNLDTSAQFTSKSNSYWRNWGLGTLRFNFSIVKVLGDSTSPLVIPNNVSVNNAVCDISSVSLGNSTFNGATFTATCNTVMGANGLEHVYIFLTAVQQNSQSLYRITIGGLFTFESSDTPFDGSSTNSAINNSANQITNNQNTNTQNIINNNNTNTQNIINNQNNNTQQQIQANRVCEVLNQSKTNYIGYLNSYGDVNISDQTSSTSDFITVSPNDELKKITTYTGNTRLCFYDQSKTLISCIQQSNVALNALITIPTNTYYLRYTINNTRNEPQYSLCRNGNQAISDGQQQINNTLNDTSGLSNNEIEDLFGDLESSDTPISDLLTMPITLINAYISGMSGTCQSISLGRLYGSNLVIPCINIEEKLGSDLWGIIDILFSLFMIFNLSQLFITAFDGITSLDDDFQTLYGARHAASPKTRVERNSDLY